MKSQCETSPRVDGGRRWVQLAHDFYRQTKQIIIRLRFNVFAALFFQFRCAKSLCFYWLFQFGFNYKAPTLWTALGGASTMATTAACRWSSLVVFVVGVTALRRLSRFYFADFTKPIFRRIRTTPPIDLKPKRWTRRSQWIAHCNFYANFLLFNHWTGKRRHDYECDQMKTQ